MTREDLCKGVTEFYADGITIIRAKNHDYAGSAHKPDVFKNFRRHGPLGFLVRMNDKLSRLESYIEQGTLEVQNEGIRDTCIDLANYSALLWHYLLDTGMVNDVTSQIPNGTGMRELRRICADPEQLSPKTKPVMPNVQSLSKGNKGGGTEGRRRSGGRSKLRKARLPLLKEGK
jgi:hypothetical protein